DVRGGRRVVDPFAVGREAVQLLAPVVEGQPSDVTGVEVEQVEVAVAGARRDEGQVLAVRRVERAGLARGVRDEQPRLAAGGGDGPDVAARDERDLRPV